MIVFTKNVDGIEFSEGLARIKIAQRYGFIDRQGTSLAEI
jgi:hypothetical protein